MTFAPGTKSFDFTPQDLESDNIPKMQITSKKVIPTVFDDIASAFTELNAGSLIAPRVAETVVTLELPNELGFMSEFDWSFEEKNILQSILGNMNSNKTMDTVNEKPEAIFSGLAQRIGVIASSAFGGEIAYRNAGYALAPLKEIFFNGNSNRTFDWNWDLYPRNKAQAEAMYDLYTRIHEQAHPIMQDVGVFQIPNEFEVEWINCVLPKVSTLACTKVDFNPTASGAPRFNKDTGLPSFMRLSMSFTEVVINTRNTLEGSRN